MRIAYSIACLTAYWTWSLHRTECEAKTEAECDALAETQRVAYSKTPFTQYAAIIERVIKEEENVSWPFGKPTDKPTTYDRQYYEEEALRPLRWCECQLTPTGRLKRNANRDSFKRQAIDAHKKLTALKAKYPDNSEQYDGWIGQASAMVDVVG